MEVLEHKNIKMCRLTDDQLKIKMDFIHNYMDACNPATASVFDSNANVVTKNVGTLMAEMNKDIRIQIKRKLVTSYMPDDIAKKYIEQLEAHEIYCHDESQTVLPYCLAATIYPFIEHGLKFLGGDSKAPKHLSSFNGGFTNLLFALSSQVAGAVATPEYLLYFDAFARLDYGDNYLEEYPDIIKQELQQVVYALNQPASARGVQSVFWNISIYDKYYYKALFENITFPGHVKNIKPNWNTVNKLQQFFLTWFNEERTKAILTFPVVTIAMLHNEEEILDKEYEEIWCNEVSKGNAFFTYLSNTVDSLSSCCRLRNNISDQINDFQYSLGAGGIQTGSINVITLNVNRFIQNACKQVSSLKVNYKDTFDMSMVFNLLEKQIYLMHQYQLGFRALFQDLINKKMMPIYDAGFIDIKKQYVTIGINGVLESAEFLGLKGNYNKDYISYLQKLFSTISEANKESSIKYDIKINCELVPAEGLGVKFAKWDKKDGYVVPRDCYNSYLYPMEDELISPISKLYLHGKEVANYMDGGSACHISLNEYPTKETCRKFLNIAVKSGCPYFCTNVKVTICNDCGYINKHTKQYCIKCGSKNIDYGVRIIGYLKRVSNFSYDRQLEEHRRYYHAGI